MALANDSGDQIVAAAKAAVASPKTVTIKGVDDAIADGNQPYSIVTSAAIAKAVPPATIVASYSEARLTPQTTAHQYVRRTRLEIAPTAWSFRRFLASPVATQIMLEPSRGVPPGRFKPPVYVTLWN